jgi:FMN-dependent NADH-azoreductase
MVSTSPDSRQPAVGAPLQAERASVNTILYLTSSRAAASISNRIGGQVLEELQRAHPAAALVVRDLARDVFPHFDEDFAAGMAQPVEARTLGQHAAATRSDILIGELLRADIIVIAVPMIDFTIPSTLKAWVDHVTRRGRTFIYGASGPQGLVTGKRVILVQAKGSVHSRSIQPYDFVAPYLKHMLGFLGITDVQVIGVEGTTLGAEVAEQAVAGGTKCAEAVASAKMTIWRKYEPTLGEILADSATRALMRADGVSRLEIEALFEEIARTRFADSHRESSCTLAPCAC